MSARAFGKASVHRANAQAESEHPREKAGALERLVAVWLVDLRQPLTNADWTTLDRAEAGRASVFAFARDRDRFVAARVALRNLLAQRLDVTAAEVPLTKGANDRPTIPAGSELSFNVSHSEDLAAIAIAGGASPLGVDIEMIRPLTDAEALVREHGTAEERVTVERAARPAEAFLRLWTRKEAAAKALGLSIGSIDLSRLEVGVDGARTLVVAGVPLQVVPFDPGPGYVGAVSYGAEFTGRIEVQRYRPSAGRDGNMHPAPLSQASEQHG
jgi:4'-phosphopantetheinyl transferase